MFIQHGLDLAQIRKNGQKLTCRPCEEKLYNNVVQTASQMMPTVYV